MYDENKLRRYEDPTVTGTVSTRAYNEFAIKEKRKRAYQKNSPTPPLKAFGVLFENAAKGP